MGLAKLNVFVRLLLLFVMVYGIWQGTLFFMFVGLVAFLLALWSLTYELYFFSERELVDPESKMRSFLHPVIDKLIVFVLFFLFWAGGLFSGGALVVFVLRDIFVNRFRWLAARFAVVLPIDGYSLGKRIIEYVLLFLLFLESVLLLMNVQFFLTIVVDWLILILTFVVVVMSLFSIFSMMYVYGRAIRSRIRKGKVVEGDHILVLVNPRSRGYRNLYRRRLLKKFIRRRKAKVIYLTDEKDMFWRWRDEIKKYNHVIIAGGDGTFESAVNNSLLSNKSLGFFPMGAGNAFYSYFYRGKKFEYLCSSFMFREVELDVMQVVWDGGKKQTFFTSVGLDAELLSLCRERTSHGFLNYFMAGTRLFFTRNANYSLRCVVDGRRYVWKNGINLTISKIPYYGFAMRSIVDFVDGDDGQMYGLACVNTHAVIFNKVLRAWALLLAQLGLDRSPLLSLKGKEVVVTSEVAFPLQAGGEFLGFTKRAVFRVVRKQKVLMV